MPSNVFQKSESHHLTRAADNCLNAFLITMKMIVEEVHAESPLRRTIVEELRATGAIEPRDDGAGVYTNTLEEIMKQSLKNFARAR